MFIPDAGSEFFHLGCRVNEIPDPGVKKHRIPDPGHTEITGTAVLIGKRFIKIQCKFVIST